MFRLTITSIFASVHEYIHCVIMPSLKLPHIYALYSV